MDRITNSDKKIDIKNKIKHFIDSIYFYQEQIGLLDWEINIDEGSSDEDRAWIYSDIQGRLSTIFFSKAWMYKPSTTLEEINRVAFHEVIEALLEEIRFMMLQFYSTKLVNSRIHSIVRRMENILWPKFGTDNVNYSGKISTKLKQLISG